VICGGVLLCFLLYTPFAIRRFGAPAWAKTLMMAIPTLAICGLMAFTMVRANKAIVGIKERVKPCMAENFDQLEAEPDALVKRSQMVGQLKREVAALQTGRARRTVFAPHDRAPEL
jgi:hypothetical protein